MQGFWAGGSDCYTKAMNAHHQQQLSGLKQKLRECSSEADRVSVQDEIAELRAEIREERRNRRRLIF